MSRFHRRQPATTTELHSPATIEKQRWTRLAAHVGAGLRLRLAFDQVGSSTARDEAALEGDGRLHDASGAAKGMRARERLQEAVRSRECARTRLQRSDTDGALARSEGLVAGRWSLVDRFEGDGKRFVAAHQNDPDVGDPRGLTRRERQIAEYIGLCHSSKETSYMLGLAASAVSNATRRAAGKLGLSGSGELASFLAPDGLRAPRRVRDRGEWLAMGAAPLADEAQLARLSAVERDVALELLRSATVAAFMSGE